MTQELEFHISVTPVGGNEYLVRTEDVAQGVPLAEAQVSWPVEEWLACARQLMNDPLLGLFEGSEMQPKQTALGGPSLRRLGSYGEGGVASLLALGRDLHHNLFQGRLRDSWISAQSIAQHLGAKLRLRLALKGNDLPRLPWEVLHDGNQPIATGKEVLFSRYQPPTTTVSQSVFEQRSVDKIPTALKILMVLAGPTDQDRLQLKQEAEHLKRELQTRSPASDGPAMQLTILEQPDRATLTQALEHSKYQVFHYAGHSNLGSSGGELYLVNRKTGLTERLTGYDLAGLLANNGVQLAVFNSCRGAGMSSSLPTDDTGERSLAEALVKRGIPAVLAMAERIPDDVALTLARLFYRNLNLGQSVDLSLSRARQGLISAYGSNQLFWALPILFLHPKFDGYLRSDHQINSILSSQNEVSFLPSLSQTRSPQPAEPDDIDNLDDAEIEDILYEMDYTGLNGDFSECFKDDDLMDLEEFNEDLGESFNDQPQDDGAEAVVASLFRQLPSSLPLKSANPPTSPDLIFSDEELEEYDLEKYQQSASDSDSTSQRPPSLESKSIQPIEPPRLIAPASQKLNNSVLRPLPSPNRLNLIPKAVAGVLALGVVTVLGFWFLRSRVEEKQMATPIVSSVPARRDVLPERLYNDLKKSTTSQVVALAIERLSQGDLAQGLPPVEVLLNRGALPQAQGALAAIPKAQENQPEVNFLRGRLAWQFAAAGNELYSQSDARRFWEIAVKDNGKSAEYFNALAFAYYAEGNLDRAAQMWGEVLNLLEKNPSAAVRMRADLTAYAGSALVFYKQSKVLAGEQKDVRVSKAIKFRNYILSEDAVNFQPDSLAKNWMWSESSIKDWQGVMVLK